MDSYPYRLGLQQRVLPAYRAPFFEALAAACAGGLSVFAGEPRPEEAIEQAGGLKTARLVQAHNIHLLQGRFYFFWQAGLLDWLKRWDPGALVVEANPRNLSNDRAVRWMRSRRRPVIGWGLGAPRVTVSTTAPTFAAGYPAECIFVAPNAAVHRPTQPPPPRPPEFQGQPTVLFVGRLQARKRIDHLLQACAALPSDQQPRLVIVGDGPARPELEALAQVIFPPARFAGAHYGAELESFFTAADLFVLPGTGGLAVQQALAHGLPVIVAEADGTQNDLVRPENGWQIPPGDLAALTRALQDALADAPRLRRMGTASYRIAVGEVNLETMLAAFLRALAAVTPAQAMRKSNLSVD